MPSPGSSTHAVDPSIHIAPVEVRKTENLREHVVECCPVPDPARIELDDWILHELRFSNPFIRPESIQAISSRSALSCSCRSGGISVCRTASSKSGTHSCTLLRAIPKKLRRSGFVKRPLPRRCWRRLREMHGSVDRRGRSNREAVRAWAYKQRRQR
jgi:hypothetical protein